MRKFIFILLLTSSCTTGIPMKSVMYDHLFNDSNSKVWMVDKMYKGNAVISPTENKDKHLMIFHANGNCDYIALKNINDASPQKAWYYIDSEKRTLLLEFSENTKWKFDLTYLTEDSILMDPIKSSDMEYSIQLKPFPEL